MIQKYLSYSSLTLGLLTLMYSTYILFAHTTGYDRSYTDKEFLGSFFLAMAIIVFGLYIQVNEEDPKNSVYMKNNRRYRLWVLISLFIMCMLCAVFVYSKL
jgi:hypothetical protein